MSSTEEIVLFILEAIVVVVFFALTVQILKWAYNKLASNPSLFSNKLLNPNEYLPEEDILSQRQIYYIAMILLCVLNFLYITVFSKSDVYNLSILDIFISYFIAVQLDFKSNKNKVLLILLVPYWALSNFIFPGSHIGILDMFHAIGFIYFIKEYSKKFMDSAVTNSLGITILLLFAIVFVSFLITMPVENVTPLNSLEMVSNAFTSNGYAILGKTALGKMNALFLVWSGFALSCIGTATLTASIIMRHLNKRFDNLEDMIKRNKKN